MRLSEIIPNLDPTAIYPFEVRIEGSSGRAITASMDTASLVIADQNGNQTPATVKAAAVKIITFNMTGAALQAMAVNGKATLSIAVGNAVGFASNSIRIENIKINQYVANSSQQLAIRIGAGYKYGFNGYEKDDEVSGSGNSYDYGFRIYNPRLGRFLSVDPIAKNFPWYTPYQFAGNKPIVAIDLDGKEEYIYHYSYNNGEPILIDKTHNVEWRVDEANFSSQGVASVPYNKETGEPLRSEEFGQAQYQYFEEGNRKLVRRNLNGDFVEGENEFMQDWTENLDGSVYMGSNNPPTINGQEDYRREPQDEVDAIAKEHDQDFDAAAPGGLKGLKGTMDKRSSPANEKAIESADKLLNKKTDRITGRPVTDKTKERAKTIKLFKVAEKVKNYTPPKKPAGGYQ